MAGHLKDDVLMDALEGAAGEQVRLHLEGCAACAARVEEARAGWRRAREAADMPEPSPLYWDAFRRQLERRIAGEPAPPRWRFAWWPAGLLAAAGAVVAAVTVIGPGRHPAPASPSAARVVPAWTMPAEVAALDPFEAAVDEAALGGECQDLADCLMQLSEEEARDLAELLRAGPGPQS